MVSQELKQKHGCNETFGANVKFIGPTQVTFTRILQICQEAFFIKGIYCNMFWILYNCSYDLNLALLKKKKLV